MLCTQYNIHLEFITHHQIKMAAVGIITSVVSWIKNLRIQIE